MVKADVPELNQMGVVFFLKSKIECHLANDGASVQDLGQGSVDGFLLAQEALCVSTTVQTGWKHIYFLQTETSFTLKYILANKTSHNKTVVVFANLLFLWNNFSTDVT